MALNAPVYTGEQWPEHEERRCVEYWSVTGTTGAVGDTTTFTPRFVRTVFTVIGPFVATQNPTTKVVTLTATAALAANTTAIKVVGQPGPP
jgi:hypothetical protein